jgi:hypothetical protein
MPRFTDADVAYIRDRFRPLEQLCAERGVSPDRVRELIRRRRLPRPAYVLDDGTEMVAPDYFGLADAAGGAERLHAYFVERFRERAMAAGLRVNEATLAAEWNDYLTGLYAVCLREVTVEDMVRKTLLVGRIGELLERPDPGDAGWRTRLRESVDALDRIEKPFSPDHDRRDPPSRVSLIEEPRRRYPHVFTDAA